MVSSKSVTADDLSKGDTVVYPAHGVGKVADVETQEVAGLKLELLVLTFAKERMTVRVPRARVKSSGLRRVVDADGAAKVLDILGGRGRRSRGLWSRRAQEYEGKINSGDIASLAEVVRDLYRSSTAEAASYSERGIYENAFARLVSELAVALDKTETEAASLAEARMAARKPAAGAQDDDAEAEAA